MYDARCTVVYTVLLMMRESVHGCSFHVIMVMWLTSIAVCACIWYELKPCVASAVLLLISLQWCQ